MSNIIAPASIPQEQFLASNSTITLYQGSAGAGKTFAIIIALLKFAMKQNTTAVVFRRTSTQLRQNGGIWQEATMVFKQMLGKDVIIRNRDLEIYVPKTNATIKFSHLQHLSDIHSHLGAQYSLVIYDEATLFPFEEMILPLMGRMRNARTDYPSQMMWATNPMYNHGIYHWIKDFYLDEFGIPLPEKSNIERFFVLENNKPIWFNSRQEAEAVYGSAVDNGVQSFRAIRAHVSQNIPLLKANPQYINNLKSLPDIKRRIFLDGSWTAREEEAGLFLRSMVTMVDHPNLRAKARVRSYDLASQPVSTQSPNPDWTRGVLVSKEKNGVYTIEDVVSIRDRPHVVEQLIYDTARLDGPDVVVTYPIDPGQAGIARANDIKRKLAEMGVTCKLIRPNKSKRSRFLAFSAISEAGFVNVVRAGWNEEFFNELEEFTGLKSNERDDLCDCCSDSVIALNQTHELPSFDVGVLSGMSSGITTPMSTIGFNGATSLDFNIHNSQGIPTSGLI